MNKANVIAELDRLTGDMEPYFRYLKRATVDAFKVERSVTDYRSLRALLRWTEALYRVEFRELEKAWNLVPPGMWAGYKAQGIKGLQEQVILAKAVEEFKKVWESRYVDPAPEVPGKLPHQVDGHESQDS